MDAMAAVAANATVAAIAPTSHLFEQVLDNHKPRVEPPFGKDNPRVVIAQPDSAAERI